MIKNIKAYFVSDIHLGSDNEPNFVLFVSWLKRLPELGVTHLFLVGDIFDLWIGNHQYFKEKYKAVIAAIVHLKDLGVEIHYFEGNHDLYLTRYWQQQLGLKVHEEAADFELGPWQVRVEHGDQVDPEDKGYIFLRWFLRTPLMKTVAKYLPGFLVVKIGEMASAKSRKYTTDIKSISEERTRKILHEHAEKVAKTKAFDWLICGHVHLLDEYQFFVGNKKCRAINLGTWLKNKPQAYVIDNHGGSWLSID